MGGVEPIDGGPRSVIVVGAGIVGLSTAWFLQERGVDVTVVDRTGVAAGASWSNAGWIAPALTLPRQPSGVLADTQTRRDPATPTLTPSTVGVHLGALFLQLSPSHRRSSSRRALRAGVALNEDCIEAFDVLIANGVDAPVTDAPITALFRGTKEAQRMLETLQQLENAGQPMYVTALSGAALREQVPLASPAVTAGLNINGQRFVDPRRFVEALGRSVMARGAAMHRLDIDDVHSSDSGAVVHPRRGDPLTADAAVIATGDRLSRLAGSLAARPGPGAERLLVHRAGGPSDTGAHLPAGQSGGLHALQRRAACFGCIGVSAPQPAAPPRAGGGHRHRRQFPAGRSGLGRAQQCVGRCVHGHPRWPSADR